MVNKVDHQNGGIPDHTGGVLFDGLQVQYDLAAGRRRDNEWQRKHQRRKTAAYAGIAIGIFGLAIVWYVHQARRKPKVSIPDKESRQNIPLSGGEARVNAPPADIGPATATVKTNRTDGLNYVWIPPGTFMMGCSQGDTECLDNENPPHQVTITKGYWLGRTAVTVGAYKRFAEATARQMPPEPVFGKRTLNAGWGDEAMPIVDVTWDDAQAYCSWAGGRLPTEAEWEYAARAGSTTSRYGDLDEIAWYADNSGHTRVDSDKIWKEDRTNYEERLKEYDIGMREVGQKRANEFGLYDILGNVWTWVNDWFDEKYYQGSPSQDPAGPTSGRLRALRGGSWDGTPWIVRVSFRGWFSPGLRRGSFGIRCGGELFATPPASGEPTPGTGVTSTNPPAETPTTFAGYEIEVRPGKIEAEDNVPLTAAEVCAKSTGSKLCYTPPSTDPQIPPYGLDPKVAKVTLHEAEDALLFRATSTWASSASRTFLGLLQIRNGHLVNVMPETILSEICEYELWNEPDISPAPIVAAANFEWGEGETHFGSNHRFRVESFTMQPSGDFGLSDVYVTTNTYDPNRDNMGVLSTEKPTVLFHLRQKSSSTVTQAIAVPSAPRLNNVGPNSGSNVQPDTEAPASAAIKPTFDCRKAKTPTERLICRDGTLATMERSMVAAYNEAMQRRSVEQRKVLRLEHLQWFRGYAQACDAARSDSERRDCVIRHLTDQTVELIAQPH